MARLVANGQAFNLETHVIAVAAELFKVPCRSLCCWCYDKLAYQDDEGARRTSSAGGLCECCGYFGEDCLIVSPLLSMHP